MDGLDLRPCASLLPLAARAGWPLAMPVCMLLASLQAWPLPPASCLACRKAASLLLLQRCNRVVAAVGHGSAALVSAVDLRTCKPLVRDLEVRWG